LVVLEVIYSHRPSRRSKISSASPLVGLIRHQSCLFLSMSSSDPQNSASGSQDPTSFLRSATFSRDGPAVSVENAVTANDLLLGAYDPAKLHPLAQLGDQLDYLVLDDDKTSELPGAGTAIPSRGWSDDLCYGTGTMYLSGRSSLFRLLNMSFARVCTSTTRALSFQLLSPYRTAVISNFGHSYCFRLSHAHPSFLKVWLWAAFGV